jgi:hypothetical protein
MTLAAHVSQDENGRVEDVRDRLRQRFPHVDDDLVTRTVDEAHRELDTASIRDFVPILVEKRARDVLSRLSR